MNKDAYFNGSVETNPHKFRNYDISEFSRVPCEGLTLGKDHEKTSMMDYRALFEESGMHHWNSGIQITHDMFINIYFMLLFYLTPDSGASECHTSIPENGNIRIELLFANHYPSRSRA